MTSTHPSFLFTFPGVGNTTTTSPLDLPYWACTYTTYSDCSALSTISQQVKCNSSLNCNSIITSSEIHFLFLHILLSYGPSYFSFTWLLVITSYF